MSITKMNKSSKHNGKGRIIQVYGAHISNAYGGHEYVVRRLSEEIAKRDFKVELIFPALNSKPKYYLKNNVNYSEIPSIKIHQDIHLPKLFYMKKLINMLRQAKLVHVHCPENPFVFFIALLSKILGKPLIATILAYADNFKHHDKRKRLMAFIITIQQIIIVWLANKLHVESIYDMRKLHIYKNKMVVISPGIEDDFFKLTPSQATIQRIKEKILFRDEEKLVLYIGRVHKAKGVDHAVLAINTLKKNGYNVKLIIAGPDRGFMSEVQRLVHMLELENNVIFLGVVSDEEKIALLNLMDVVIIPSLSDIVEAYSLVASEAWAREKPVVAYNIGALKYRIKEPLNGYLANPGDPKDLSEKIGIVLRSMPRPYKCEDVHNWDKSVKYFMQLY